MSPANRRILSVFLFISVVGYFLIATPSSSRNSEIQVTNSSQEIVDYLQQSNSTSCLLANDFGGSMAWFVLDGQKAVCLDTQVRPMPNKCLVYSFGVNNEWSFEDMMETYGCDVYAFDPSMNKSDHDRSPKIHFFRYGLGSEDLVRQPKGWHLMALSDLYRKMEKRHGRGRVIDYLKIDIESDEWIALPQILQSGMMDRVRQLGVEIHLPVNGTMEQVQERIGILKSLENYGMVRFDSKPNVFSEDWIDPLNMESYWAYELAWYNNRLRRKKRTQYMVAEYGFRLIDNSGDKPRYIDMI